jgi:tetratricopeptide (TPR) repeat protein
MRRIRQSPLILIIGGVAGVFLLLSLSRTAPTPAYIPKEVDPYLAKMQLAMVYMEGGQGPMQGIKLFRKVAEQYPERYEAPYKLGEMAMSTGQYARAAGWFSKAAKAATGENKAYCLLNWSDALVMSNNKDSAILILNEVSKYTNDSLLLASIKTRINALPLYKQN